MLDCPVDCHPQGQCSPRVKLEQNATSQFLLMLVITKPIERVILGLLHLDDRWLGFHDDTRRFWGRRRRCREECREQLRR